jgi:hypothetical protein
VVPPPVRTAPPTGGEKTLYFSRDPVQSHPVGTPAPALTPRAPDLPVQAPGVQALGTVQVTPPYTGTVIMPTTAPAPTPPGSGSGMPGAPMSERQRRLTEEGQDYTIQLEFPSPSRITRLESEAALKERMRNEFRRTGERIVFPEEPVLSKEPYQGRHWPQMVERVEPNYVCYGRLLFEQTNTDRYGWSMGILQPVISSLQFYTDVFLLPYKLGTRPCDHTECSAGRCLPGDPVPLALYPPQLSVTGLLAQTGAVAAGFFIFP